MDLNTETIIFFSLLAGIFLIIVQILLLVTNIYALVFELSDNLRYKIFYNDSNSSLLKYHFSYWKNLFDEEDSTKDIEIKNEIKQLSIKAEILFFVLIVSIVVLIFI